MRRRWWILAVVALIVVVSGGLLAAKAVRSQQQQAAQAQTCKAVRSLEQHAAAFRSDAAKGSGPLVAVLGDSYAEGLKTNPRVAFPYKLGSRVWVDAAGGSGYFSEGPCGGGAFGTRIATVLALHPSVLIVEGGTNDVRAASVRSAVARVFSTIRKAHVPKVVVLSPFSAPALPADGVKSVTETLRGEAAAAHFEFIDVSTLRLPHVSDGLHPTQAGQDQIAARLRAQLHL